MLGTYMSVKVLLTIMDGQCAVLLTIDERLRFATNKNISFCLASLMLVAPFQHEDVRGQLLMNHWLHHR